jgi:hypothetical protein
MSNSVIDAKEDDDTPDPESEPASPALAEGSCPHCLLVPCVATSQRDARWLGNGLPPHAENAAIRRGLYKRFWNTMANLGGWHTPQYVAKKMHIGGGQGIVYHKREIMPDCVLKLCRDLYPNPKDKEYMGHKWE